MTDKREAEQRLVEACRLYKRALDEARDCCGCGAGWDKEDAADRILADVVAASASPER